MLTQKLTRKRLTTFLKKFATEDKILDVGSGGSAYDQYFPNRITVDIDPKRKPDIVADAESLPVEDNSFSVVLCTEALEHMKRPRIVIGEMRRVLSKNGVIILTTRFIFPLHDTPHDYWRFTEYGLRELFREWEIIELVPEAHSFATIGILFQRLAFQNIYHVNNVFKGLLLIAAHTMSFFDRFTKEERGSFSPTNKETTILTSGYYIVCRKK